MRRVVPSLTLTMPEETALLGPTALALAASPALAQSGVFWPLASLSLLAECQIDSTRRKTALAAASGVRAACLDPAGCRDESTFCLQC